MPAACIASRCNGASHVMTGWHMLAVGKHALPNKPSDGSQVESEMSLCLNS